MQLLFSVGQHHLNVPAPNSKPKQWPPPPPHLVKQAKTRAVYAVNGSLSFTCCCCCTRRRGRPKPTRAFYCKTTMAKDRGEREGERREKGHTLPSKSEQPCNHHPLLPPRKCCFCGIFAPPLSLNLLRVVTSSVTVLSFRSIPKCPLTESPSLLSLPVSLFLSLPLSLRLSLTFSQI